MLNKIVKLALVASALSVSLTGAAAAKPKFSIVKLESLFDGSESSILPDRDKPPTVHVDWQDGRWTRIHDELLEFNVAYHVKMKRGYVHSLRIGTAERGSRVKDSLVLRSFWEDRSNGHLQKEEKGTALIVSSAGHLRFDTAAHLTSKQREDVVAACNANANGNNHFTTSYDVPLAMRARGAPLKDAVFGYYGRSVTKNVIGLIRFKVICDPPEQHVQNPPPPRAGNELYSVDLKVDQHGETCPKDVTVTAYANYKWLAKSRMRMAVNGGFPKVRIAETKKVTFAGKTFHRAEAQFKYKLDPGQKTFKLTVDGKKGKTHTEAVEINCPPFKVMSAWLKYDVEQTPTCPKKVTETATFHTTRPGWVNHEIRMKGGLVVSSGKLTSKRVGDKYVATAVRTLTMNAIDSEFMADAVDYPANSGWVPLEVKCLDLKGDFSFVDAGAPKCPRTGKALITFKSNMPDNIHYSLDCTNGQHLSGYVKPVKQPNGDYVAAALKTFQVDKTSVYSCALKTVQPGPAKLHQWKSHKFDCVIPSVETGSTDVQVAPKPTDAEDRKKHLEALKKRREAAKKAAAEKRRKAKIAAEKRRKAKIAVEKRRKAKIAAEKRRREILEKRQEEAKEKKKKKQRKVRRKRNNTQTSSNARLRVMRLR